MQEYGSVRFNSPDFLNKGLIILVFNINKGAMNG